MDLKNAKRQASGSLATAAYSPKKLVALHTGAMLLVALVLTVLQFFLERGIADTGGLANLQSRAILTTAQSVLTLLNTVALPFWQMGLVFAALQIARGQTARPTSLAEGFRRWGPLLRLFLLEMGIFALVLLASSHIAGLLFSLTPFIDKALPVMEAFLESAAQTGQPTLSETELYKAFLPLYLIMLGVMAAVGIPIFYRLRMAAYAVLDDTGKALAALGASSRMMRHNRLSLLRVDLGFWWYYGASLLLSALPYGYLLPDALGISLPISENALYFILYILFLALTLALEWAFGARVQVTYAHCYETLKAAAPPPLPKASRPWEKP